MTKEIFLILFFFPILIENSGAQGFREKYFEQIITVLSPEYQEIIKEAETSSEQGKSFEAEGIRLRTLAEQEEQKENAASESKDLNKTIKRENKLFKKSTETYAVAADLYLEATYIKYNIYSKTLAPLENKSKNEKRKTLYNLKKEAGILYKRANFSMAKARKSENYRQQYEFYAEAVKFALDALNIQAEEFRLYYEWTPE